jgi:hypothetical protein
MAYTSRNFRTKKALKEAVAAYNAAESVTPGSGRRVECYAPGLGDVPETGTVYLEGPHYPQPHTWYAEARVVNGAVVKVK